MSEGSDKEVVPGVPIAHLETSRVGLIPVDQSHYSMLRQLEMSSSLGSRWRLRGATPSPEDYPRSLWAGVLAQFLIADRLQRAMMGLVACYDANMVGGYAYFAGTKFNVADRSPMFIEGCVLMIGHIFESWPLRKLYFDVPSFNLPLLRSGIGRFLMEEGILREHVYLAGRYWDQHTLALYRTTWLDLKPALQRLST